MRNLYLKKKNDIPAAVLLGVERKDNATIEGRLYTPLGAGSGAVINRLQNQALLELDLLLSLGTGKSYTSAPQLTSLKGIYQAPGMNSLSSKSNGTSLYSGSSSSNKSSYSTGKGTSKSSSYSSK